MNTGIVREALWRVTVWGARHGSRGAPPPAPEPVGHGRGSVTDAVLIVLLALLVLVPTVEIAVISHRRSLDRAGPGPSSCCW